MLTFNTPPGRAGTDQLYGMEESINSHLERMFLKGAHRSILEHGVGRTTSTAGGNDSKVRFHAQQRDCDAAITFHAGKAVELCMQLIYAYGTDRIIGREYPGVQREKIDVDVRKGHDLCLLYDRIVKEMHNRDMRNGFEDAYQKALNRGINEVVIDGELCWLEFATVEDIPFRERAIRFVGDGIEMTTDHSEARDLIFPSTKLSEFTKMPLETFDQFLAKADAAYYEGDISDKQGSTSRKNMRWEDYSARDHEYGRAYAVVGITFFARLAKELVALAHQQWIWHDDFALRWWQRRKYNIRQLLEAHVQQNFKNEIEFGEMISPEEAMTSFRSVHGDLANAVKRGYGHLHGKREFKKEELAGPAARC